MQNKDPKSSLIRLNNLANKKARRRLVGSIFLLVIALLVLLQVTSKIKPIQIKPESIEVKTSKKTVHQDNLSNPIIVESRSNVNNAIITTASAPRIEHIYAGEPKLTVNKPKAASSTVKAILEDKHKNSSSPDNVINQQQVAASAPDAKQNPNLHITPIIAIEQSSSHLATPEDILNGITTKTSKAQFFVQLTASKDKNKLLAIKSKLAENGIYTKLQTVKHGDNTLYRLRVGPFNDKISAKTKLIEINEKLNN